MKSLFDDGIDVKLTEDQKVVVDPLPTEIDIDNYVFEPSGAFLKSEEKLVMDIRIMFDVKHPKYSEYIKKFQNFVKEAQKQHVVIYSSGV